MLAGTIVQDPRYNFIYCFTDTMPSDAGIFINGTQLPRTALRYSSNTNWNPAINDSIQGLIGFSYEPNNFVFGDTFTVTTNTGYMPVSAYGAVTSNLLLYLDATQQQSYPGSGTAWKDLSRNGPRTCNLTNGPTFTTANNGAIVFDGVDDYVACGNLGSFPFEGTISFWMYSTAVENYRNPFSTGYLAGNACIRFEQYTTVSPYGGFNLVIGNDQGTYSSYDYSPTAVLTPNTWYNIVLAWNTGSSSLSGYMNSVSKFTTNNNVNWPSTLPSVTLGSGFDSGRYFKGRIAFAQIWNRALKATEIFQNYNFQRFQLGLGGQVVTDGLISYLHAGDVNSYSGSGTVWSDISGNKNSAVISGSPPVANGALVLNGSSQYAYIDVGAGNGNFFDYNTNSFFADVGYNWSVSVWFKYVTSPSTIRDSSVNGGNCSWCLIGKSGGIGGAETISLFVSANNSSTSAGSLNPYFLVVGIRGFKTKISAGSINNNIWNFVTVTWNGTSGRAYLNQDDRGPLNIGTAGAQGSSYFNIGATANQVANHGFEGSIAQCMVYNRAVTYLEHLKNFYANAALYNWYIINPITSNLILSLDASYYLSYPQTGTTWTDTSGYNNNGTLTNGPTFSITDGGSIVFDGVDDQIDCGDIDILGGATAATWEIWFKPSSISQSSSWQSLITTWNDPSVGVGHTWILDTRYASWSFYIRFTGDTAQYPVFAWDGGSNRNDFVSNTWYHLVGVFDSSQVNAQKVKIYINGNFISSADPGSVTSIAYKNSNERLKLAVDRGATAPFTGNIGLVRIYRNKGLTASEVSQNFNSTKTRFGYTDAIVTGGLVTHLDAINVQSYPGSGLTWYDISGNNNNVTSPTTVSLATFGVARAFNLDAIGKYFNGTCTNSISTSVTLEAWIYPAATEVSSGDRGTIILLTGINGLYMSWNKSTQAMSNYWYGHPSEGYHENAAASSRSAWSHWCSVWSFADGKLFQYTNGVKAATDASTQGNARAGTNLIIGREGDSRQFAGGIAVIRIYNRALSQSEVIQNFNASRTRFGL